MHSIVEPFEAIVDHLSMRVEEGERFHIFQATQPNICRALLTPKLGTSPMSPTLKAEHLDELDEDVDLRGRGVWDS